MPAQFVVEDGTGKSDANALITVEFLDQHFLDQGTDLSGTDAADKQAAIVRATRYMCNSMDWAGWKTYGRNHTSGAQGICFPRQGVEDKEGHAIDNDVVPIEVQKACAVLSNYEINNVGALQPTYIPHDRVAEEQVGPLKVKYDLSRTDAQGARPVLLEVIDLIGEFLSAGSNNPLAGATVRG